MRNTMNFYELVDKLSKKTKRSIRRWKNRKTTFLYPSIFQKGKVLAGTRKEIYFDPYIAEIDSQPFVFASRRNDNSIVKFKLAFFDDQPLLTEETIVLCPVANSWEERVNRGCVIYHDYKYYLWYTGQQGERSSIGLAESEDGITWHRLNHPVVMASLPYEGNSVMNPSVLYDELEKCFKMWYSAGEQYEPDVICYAISFDGVSWEKREKPVLVKGTEKYDCYKVGGCDIKKLDNGKYVMYYIGYENLDNARVCKASSADGIEWERCNQNPVIAPTRNSWDSEACYKPAYYEKNGKSYIFYNGRSGDKEAIGYAIMNENEI